MVGDFFFFFLWGNAANWLSLHLVQHFIYGYGRISIESHRERRERERERWIEHAQCEADNFIITMHNMESISCCCAAAAVILLLLIAHSSELPKMPKGPLIGLVRNGSSKQSECWGFFVSV